MKRLSPPGAMPPAALRDLPIDKGDPAEIIANLSVVAGQIALIEAVALDDFAEPAPDFRA